MIFFSLLYKAIKTTIKQAIKTTIKTTVKTTVKTTMIRNGRRNRVRRHPYHFTFGPLNHQYLGVPRVELERALNATRGDFNIEDLINEALVPVPVVAAPVPVVAAPAFIPVGNARIVIPIPAFEDVAAPVPVPVVAAPAAVAARRRAVQRELRQLNNLGMGDLLEWAMAPSSPVRRDVFVHRSPDNTNYDE